MQGHAFDFDRENLDGLFREWDGIAIPASRYGVDVCCHDGHSVAIVFFSRRAVATRAVPVRDLALNSHGLREAITHRKIGGVHGLARASCVKDPVTQPSERSALRPVLLLQF